MRWGRSQDKLSEKNRSVQRYLDDSDPWSETLVRRPSAQLDHRAAKIYRLE